MTRYPNSNICSHNSEYSKKNISQNQEYLNHGTPNPGPLPQHDFPANQLPHPRRRQLRRPSHHAPLLPPRRQAHLALRLPRNRRLAHHPPPPPRLLPPPPPRRQDRPGRPHEAARLRRRRRHRRPHRPGRLPLRLRRRQAPCLHLRPHHRLPAGVHGGVRLLPGEAEVHGLLDQLGGAADAGGGGAGPPHGRRPPQGGDLQGVPDGVPPDGGGGGGVRPDPAADRADVQEGEAGAELYAGDGDSVGHVLLRHRVLRRRNAYQQGFSGNSKRSRSARARAGKLLHSGSFQRHNLAGFLPGSDRCHILLLVSSVGDHDRRPASGHRSLGRYFLPGKVSTGEGALSLSLSLGLCFLLFRRDKAQQQPEEAAGNQKQPLRQRAAAPGDTVSRSNFYSLSTAATSFLLLV